jgi:hypothetical protein
MIKALIRFSAQNRFLVLLATAVVVGYGVYTLRHIPVDAIPDLSDTQVIVYSRWDRSPDIMEDQVTYPIVTALLGAPNVKVVRGFSDFGFSYVYVIFKDGTDIYWARSRVLEYLSKIQGSLPEGVRTEIGPDAKVTLATGAVFGGLNLTRVHGELRTGGELRPTGRFQNGGRFIIEPSGRLVAAQGVENTGELGNTPSGGQKQQRSQERSGLSVQSSTSSFYSIVAPDLLNEGRILPGGSNEVAVFNIDTTMTQTPTGSFEIDLRGAKPGSDHDQLALTGTAKIDGTLVVHLINGYVPPVGQEFDVLTAASVSGRFSKIDVVGTIAGRTFEVRYGPQKVTVVTALATGLTYESWKALAFVAAEESTAAISGAGADPDNDGFQNLIEYAFGLNPTQPDPRALQAAVIEDVGTKQTFLTLSFPWADTSTDLQYSVNASSDLRNWSSAATELLSEEHQVGLKQIRLKVIPAVPHSNLLFARLEVRQKAAVTP